MALSDNIKAIREEKGPKQIDVASHIDVDKSAYSKIEKGSRNVTVEELQGMATLFGMSMDQVVNYEGVMPQEVTIEDKSMVERVYPPSRPHLAPSKKLADLWSKTR